MHETTHDLFENYAKQYDLLFDDGTQRPEVAPGELAASALIRNGPRLHALTLRERRERAQIVHGVSSILAACQEGRFGDQFAQAHTVPPKRYDNFVEDTASVVGMWQRVYTRRGLLSPFADLATTDAFCDDLNQESVQLVLLTGASLNYVIQGRHTPRSSLPPWARRGVTNYGPRFTVDFIDGGGLQQTDLPPIPDWLTVDLRKRLLMSATRSLGTSLETMSWRYKQYSDANIQRLTGWSIERVQAVFPEYAKRSFAYTHRRTLPKDIITAVKETYETKLQPETLAQNLGLTSLQLEATFKPGVLNDFVVRAPLEDPTPKLQLVLDRARSLTNKYPISYQLAVYLAHNKPEQAEKRIKTALEQLPLKPADISERLWLSTVIRYPEPGDQRRKAAIASAYQYWNFLRTISYSVDDQYKPAVILSDTTFAPEHLLFEDDGLEAAREQAAQLITGAGLTQDESTSLLDYFNNPEQEPSLQIRKLIDRIRESVGRA